MPRTPTPARAPARRNPQGILASSATGLFSGPAGPWAAGLIALAMVLGYWIVSARHSYHGELTGHINVGRFFLNKSPEPFKPRVQIQRHVGFDGQFFLYLACDPLLRHSSTIARLDTPLLRARRIGYPLTVWALARGKATRAPKMMFWTCAAAIALITILLGAVLRRQGASPARALLFPLSYSAIMCFHWVTSESLAMALVAGSMVCLEKERPRVALLLAMGAGLTKEIALLWPLAIMVHSCFRGDWRRGAFFSLAPLPLLFWMLYLHFGLKLGVRLGDDANNFSWPFLGAGRRLIGLLSGSAQGRRIYPLADGLLVFVVLAAPFVAVLRLLRDRSPENIALVLAALLSVSLPPGDTWWAGSNFTRQSFLLILFLFFAAARSRPRKSLSGGLALLCSIAGVAYLAQYFYL